MSKEICALIYYKGHYTYFKKDVDVCVWHINGSFKDNVGQLNTTEQSIFEVLNSLVNLIDSPI